MLLIGTIDFGRAIFAYNSVSNAARSAARVAIVDQAPADVDAAARAEAVGLDPLRVTASYADGGITCAPVKIGCIASVEVQHDWQPVTPILNGVLGPITITSASKMPVERVYLSPAP
ncbi:MAG: pilus assembly protein [Chloroflexota bacterium]|nr:pilus assembly protein [Chloroflexota bacterium]